MLNGLELLSKNIFTYVVGLITAIISFFLSRLIKRIDEMEKDLRAAQREIKIIETTNRHTAKTLDDIKQTQAKILDILIKENRRP